MIERQPYIHGYDVLDQRELLGDNNEDDENIDWDAEFSVLIDKLRTFLACRDGYMALGKTAHKCIFDNLVSHNRSPHVELAGLEILQAILLTIEVSPSNVPTSPHNFSRAWKDLGRLLKSFSRRQSVNLNGDDPFEVLSFRIRVQTMYYRFPFNQDVCREVMSDILGRVDSFVMGERSFEADFRILSDISEFVSDRFQDFMQKLSQLVRSRSAEEAVEAIEYFCAISHSACHLWSRCGNKPWSHEELRLVGFQLSELATPSIFFLEREDVAKRFGDRAIRLLEMLSIEPGELRAEEFDRYVMDNPVWQKPFIRIPNGNFMLPIQYFAYSYPFKIAEVLIGTEQKTLVAYSKARSQSLEDAIAELLGRSMPSAVIYRNVLWDDPETGVRYENDTVAVLGNFIFVFEAKSGKINPAARRGGKRSLNKNIRELFIEPREQSSRLQSYLNNHRSDARLWEKQSGKNVLIDLSKPKLAFSFSVCFEHFASLSSSKHYFASSGLFGKGKQWAPVFSLGELRMISDFLDSEIAFVHYLTRRYWIESQIDFDGDEQDLLSMYLTNGFCLLGEFPTGKRVLFHGADDAVRVRRSPASDRRSARAIGVELPPLWKNTVDEIYRSERGTDRHKFDIICNILNQPPPSLYALQKRVRKWRAGAGGAAKGPQASTYVVASRQFVLAISLKGKELLDEESLRNEARLLATDVADEFDGVTDVVVFLYFKKSTQTTHDGVFFFRVGTQKMDLVM